MRTRSKKLFFLLTVAVLISAGVGMIANTFGIGGGIIHVPARASCWPPVWSANFT